MPRRFDDLLLGSIELFCLAAEKSSFTAAATAAGITPAAVSRSIARLESRLGVRLFVRTTRQIRLTEIGQGYFRECQDALSRLADAERAVTGEQASPSGTIRISLPTTYAHYRILPLLADFQKKYPEVRIEIHISNQNVDFLAEEFDLAVRARTPADSSMIARKLEDAELVVVGAPAYLRRRGVPRTLEDLQNHNCIQFLLPRTGRQIPWMFRKGKKEIEVMTDGTLCCAEDVLGGITLARNGSGLFQTPRFLVEEDLRKGLLKEVLQPFAGCSRPFSLIYPHGRHLPARVRVFVDFLLASLNAD